MTDVEKELITRAAMLERCLLLEAELAARRAVVATANTLSATHTMDEANELNERQYHALQSVLGPLVNSIYVPMHQRICPTCGAPLPGGVPAQDDVSISQKLIHADSSPPAPDANIANEPKPSGYMSREKML